MTNFKVLVVDDEAEFASTLAERLNMRNFKTEMAYSGGQALAMVNLYIYKHSTAGGIPHKRSLPI